MTNPSSPSLLARAALLMIAGYRRAISPLLGPICRFTPSCSVYTRDAILRFGFFSGGTLGAWRIARCHPLCDGGEDPVPEQLTFPRCRDHSPPPP